MNFDLKLDDFSSISLDKMNQVRLMKRADKKYLISRDTLNVFLNNLKESYYMQEIKGNRCSQYSTLYYDTPDYVMYHTHQNGKLNRLKIRTREYVDSQTCFLEIKSKSNKGVTRKVRINNNLTGIDDNESSQFINTNSPYSNLMLEPKINSQYKRITLVNKEKNERLTIDYDLQFSNICTSRKVLLPNLVIVEIKREMKSNSLAESYLKNMRVKPFGISKYCLGAALTDANTKQNNIKCKILTINKITDIIYARTI